MRAAVTWRVQLAVLKDAKLDVTSLSEPIERMMGETPPGLLSNAEPVLMQNAFKAVAESEKRFTKVELEIEVVPIKVFCAECNLYSIIENYSFKCRHCGKPNNNITGGNELLISKVIFNSGSLSH